MAAKVANKPHHPRWTGLGTAGATVPAPPSGNPRCPAWLERAGPGPPMATLPLPTATSSSTRMPSHG
eukprot:7599170-Alexandrium_andersonii.AAC.1